MAEQLSMFEQVKDDKSQSITKEEREQMQNLIVFLNQASLAYYQEAREIMPNKEYDRLYDMLVELEENPFK